MCVCVYKCGWALTCTRTCTGLEDNLRFLSLLFTLFKAKPHCHLLPRMPKDSWPTGFWILLSLPPTSPQVCWDYRGTYCLVWLFLWLPGIHTQIFMFALASTLPSATYICPPYISSFQKLNL